MNRSAFADRHTATSSSLDASGLAIRRFSAIVPENSCTSWGTAAMRCPKRGDPTLANVDSIDDHGS